MKLSNTFKLISEQMIKELEFIKAGPNELKGRSREIVLKRFLEPFVPTNMGVCNGVVISTNGKSGEIDLIIYDKKGLSLFRPFFDYYPENLRPIPAETVYAVIEVESELSEFKTKRCMSRIKKVKELPKTAYYKESGPIIHVVNMYGKEWKYFPTLGIIFAFNAYPEKVLHSLKRAEYKLEHKVDLVCILKKGLITWYDSKRKLLLFPPEPMSELVFREGIPEENLKIFYLMLTRIFAQAWTRPIRIMDYFKV